jgi:hypothetical protein
MSGHRDEKWLDDRIRKVVGGEAPEFDAEQWKKAFPDEYEVLASRSSEGHLSATPKVWVLRHRWMIARVAIAAAIVIGSAILLSRSGAPERPHIQPGRQIAKEPLADMLTLGSLRSAYARGGLDAVEAQFDEVSRRLAVRPVALSMGQLLASSNGS